MTSQDETPRPKIVIIIAGPNGAGKTTFARPFLPEEAIARVAERVRQGGHNIPEGVVRRRFAAGLRNFELTYKSAVSVWAKYDNVGQSPILLEWGRNQ